MVDSREPNVDVDPYDPSSFGRFPRWINTQYIKDAKKAREEFTKKLSKTVRDRIYHIRGVKENKTPVKLRWEDIDGSTYNPKKDMVPIRVKKEDRGAWAARLAQVDDKRVYDLKKAKNHMDLMEHEETLDVIRFVVENNRLPKNMPVKNKKFLGVKSASDGTLEKFIVNLDKGTIKFTDKEVSDPKIWRAVINGMST
jgi:hypothetical protein